MSVRVCVSASAAGIHTVTKVRYLPVSVFTVLPHLTVTRGTECRVSSRRLLLALTLATKRGTELRNNFISYYS